MTTTPSVADVLGGRTGPGVFPDDINLAFNDHVRHHLVHFPDISVRPGGMTFGSGHSSTVPEADRYYFEPDELALTLDPVEAQIELAEPLELHWTLKNTSRKSHPGSDGHRDRGATCLVTVTDPRGRAKLMPSFVIRTDHVTIVPLEPGKGLKAETRVFWSSRGFAFTEPGKYERRGADHLDGRGDAPRREDEHRHLGRLPEDGRRQRGRCDALHLRWASTSRSAARQPPRRGGPPIGAGRRPRR